MQILSIRRDEQANGSALKNITGEEEWAAAEDGTVYWQNLGKEIHYEGVSDAALPVDLKVTYFLDGEELPLEKKGEKRTGPDPSFTKRRCRLPRLHAFVYGAGGNDQLSDRDRGDLTGRGKPVDKSGASAIINLTQLNFAK